MSGFGQALNSSGLNQPSLPFNPQAMSNIGQSSAWQGTPAHQIGFAQNFSPQVQSQFAQFSQNPGMYDISKNPLYGDISQALSKNLQPFDQNQAMQFFDQGVANPAMKYYEQMLLPQIKAQGYGPSGTRHTGSLDRAIASSAENLSSNVGALRANYLNQAQNQYQNNQLNSAAQALGLLQAPQNNQMQYFNQLFGAKDVSALIQNAEPGWLQTLVTSLIGAIGNVTGLRQN